MASTDARPFPQKNVAYRVTFPILDADGDLVTGAASLDSEISKDGGTFADCTNEATEIATNSGMYFLDLTSTEMNADTAAIIIKTATSGAKTTAIVMYPEEAGDIRVNATQWASTTTASSNVALKNTLAKTTDITGFNDISTAQVNTECDTALADVGVTTTVTGRIDVAVSSRASQSSLDAVDDFVDTEILAIKAKTDALPTDPADQSLIIAATDAIFNRIGAPAGASVSADIAAIDGIVDAILLDTGTNGVAIDAAAATAIADALLKRDWTAVSGEAAYSALNALRFLRNVWNVAGATLSVKKEDGSTNAWTRTVASDPAAEPITGVS